MELHTRSMDTDIYSDTDTGCDICERMRTRARQGYGKKYKYKI